MVQCTMLKDIRKDGSVYYAKGVKKGSIEATFLQHLENLTSSYHGCHLDASG